MATYSINVGVNAAQAARGIQQLRSSLRNLNATADRSRNILSTLFVVPLFGIFTLQAALVNLISTLAEYSSAMATVRAVSAATVNETAALNKEFQRLGITTKFTATEAAGAGVFLSRAGFAPPQIAAIVEDSLDLALATGIDPDKAADIATNVLTAFNLPVDKLGDVFDQLAFVANRTNTDLTQLAEALKFIGPAAESANIPLNEVISALGILAQSGLRGSIAGTGLRRVIAGLASESPIVRKRLAELGIAFDEVDVKGGDLIGVFSVLIENGVGLGEAFALFGQRGGPAFEAIADRVPELIRLSKEVDNASGFVRRLVTIMETSLTFVLAQVKSAFEGIVLAVGELIDVNLKQFLAGITESLRATAKEAELLVNIIQAITLTIGTVFGLFLARLIVPLLGFLTGLTNVGRAASVAVTSVFGTLAEGTTRVRVLLVGVLGILTSIAGVAKIAFIGATTVLAAFSSEINLTYSRIVTLEDFLLSLGRSIIDQFTDVNTLVDESGSLIGGLSDRLLEFIQSESFGRGLVRVFDLIIRAALIAKEAVSLIFDPGALFGPIILGIQIQLVRLTEAVVGILTRLIDSTRESLLGRIFSEDRALSYTEQLRQEADKEINRLDAEARLAERAPQFGAIADLISSELITFNEVLVGSTNRAVTRSLEGYRDRIQILADPPLVREPLGAAPERLVDDDKRNRLFDVYLMNLQTEQSILQVATENRKFHRALLAAEAKLAFTLVESERERLRLIIAQGIEAQAQDTITNATVNLLNENAALKTNSEERARNNFIRQLEREINRDIIGTDRELLLGLYDENEALKNQDRILQGLRGAEQQRMKDRTALNELYAQGAIGLRELNRELLALEIAALQERVNSGEGTFFDGFILSLNKFAGDFTNIFSELGTIVGDFATSAIDQFANFVGEAIFSTGDLNEAFKALARSLISDLVASLVKVAAQLIINNALAAVFNVLTGGSGIFGGILGFSQGGIVAFQRGGEIQGPGTSTSDSILARLSRGEFVVNADATRRNRSALENINAGGSGGERPILVTYNISTPDANSFRRSQGQILGATEASLSRAAKRQKNEF